jgi:outer membrane protein TolC
MPARFCRIGFCMLALAGASLHAEEIPLGPQELLNGLMQKNPEIQAARYRFEAATKRPSQAGTLPEPSWPRSR